MPSMANRVVGACGSWGTGALRATGSAAVGFFVRETVRMTDTPEAGCGDRRHVSHTMRPIKRERISTIYLVLARDALLTYEAQ